MYLDGGGTIGFGFGVGLIIGWLLLGLGFVSA